MRRVVAFILLGAAVAAQAFVPAATEARSVPYGFVGMNMGRDEADEPAWSQPELALMARSGVESLRAAVYWSRLQPAPGRLELGPLDALVVAAARNGITVLPTVLGAPGWAELPGRGPELQGRIGGRLLRVYKVGVPRDPADYGRFLAVLAARYGPRGSIWAQNPRLLRRPIREWQVWNEPDLPQFWTPRFAPSYVRLLRAARVALRAVDPGARIVLAGLATNIVGGVVRTTWRSLQEIYDAGGRGLFDAVSVHPYSESVGNMVLTLRRVREIMRRAGDSRVPLAITEFGWSSRFGARGARRQSTLVADSFARLAALRRRLRIESAYWYMWSSPDSGHNLFQYTGLRRQGPHGMTSKPAMAALRRVALELEGCDAKARADRCLSS